MVQLCKKKDFSCKWDRKGEVNWLKWITDNTPSNIDCWSRPKWKHLHLLYNVWCTCGFLYLASVILFLLIRSSFVFVEQIYFWHRHDTQGNALIRTLTALVSHLEHFTSITASSCLALLHATSTSSHYTFPSCRPTRVQRARWSIGSSGLCCLAWICGSPWTLHSGSPRTYCQCSLWLAANWKDGKKDIRQRKGEEIG